MKNDERDEYIPENTLSRRDFLKLTGGGILICVTFGEAALLQEGQRRMGGQGYPEDFNAYLLVHPDGRVTGYTGKIEMGEGIINSLPMELADELDVRLDAVDMVMGDTELCPWDMGTFGSLATRMFGPALRAAAAEARAVLVELASEKLKVPAARLATRDGVVFDRDHPSVKATYGELASGKKIERHITPKPSPKKASEWTIMGKPVFRRDARAKVTGGALFAGDVRVPGMLYAKILRPPAHGATLKSLDTSAAEKVAGVRIVHDGELVAALHELPDVAAAALGKIKAEYEPSPSTLDDKNIFDHLLKVAPQGQVVAHGGDLEAGKAASAATFDETYLNSYVAHSPIETHTTLVRIEGGKATVWPSSQTPFRLKEEIAPLLGLSAANVRVISPFVGGGFGGKSAGGQSVQAARLAKITGRPVQVAWTRPDEFFNDTFRPAAIVKIKSGIDAAGKIVLWDYAVYYAGDRSAAHFYDIPNHRTVAAGEWGLGGGNSHAHPFAVGPWRGPGSNTNVYARESQIDIMAAKAEMDPLEFRMANLNDERMKRLLRVAADKFGWTAAATPSGRGFGLSCTDYNGTYVVTMAEVGLDKATGAVQPKRIVCAQDMGQCVNPEGAAIQVEGCCMMGLGYALSEEVHFRNGEILDLNFDTYELPRFSRMPRIEAVIVRDDEHPPSGGGEPAITNMGAVMANAVFDASGARLFQLPMTRERIKTALEAAART